jgi:WD40 repeat protein
MVKPRIFISYARRDGEEPLDPERSFVLRIFRDLSARGFDVWLDRRSMPSRQLTFSREIRDAIAERDRLLLIVGPAAVKSEYVRREWTFAFERADKAVTPILRRGDYALLPQELRALHCEDFRDDAQYEFHFENLVRELADFPPVLGRLINLPALPTHYINRMTDIDALLDAFVAPIGISGMGGIGKSVLANAIVRDYHVRRAFPDGIIWISVGIHPDLVTLQQRVHRQMGGDGAIASVVEGRQKLKDRFRDKRLLLVVDDAWQRGDVEAFNALGPRISLLVTTRDRGLLVSMRIDDRNVENMTLPDARQLLASYSGLRSEKLPAEAEEVIRRCAGLPLAIALCGGMVRAGETWQDVAENLRERELEYISDEHALEEKHRTLQVALELSIEALGKEEQRRFAELAVFPGDVPENAVLVLWAHTGALRPRHARKLLRHFEGRSLLQLGAKSDTGSITVSRHDLLRDLSIRLAEERIGDDSVLHDSIVEAYRAVTPAGWWSGPNDGYFFASLADHLTRSGRVNELAELVQRLEWLEAKTQHDLTHELLRDYATALRALPRDDARAETLSLIERALRRDVHFIAPNTQAYPQVLFQCLWNTCWWEKSPALTSLMESWRKQKEQRTPGFAWLRSMRPSPWSLRSSLIRKLPSDSTPSHGSTFTFSPSDHLLAFKGERGLYVLDVQSGARAGFVEPRDFHCRHLAFSRDEQLLCGIGFEADDRNAWAVRTWRIDDGVCIARTQLDGELKSFARDRAGDCIAAGMQDGVVSIIRIPDTEQVAVTTSNGRPPRSLVFSADGRQVVAGYADGTLITTDLKLSATRKVQITSGCEHIAFLQDTRVIAATEGNHLSLWDCDNGVPLNEFTLQHHRLTFSADGTRLASGGPGSSVRVWMTETGQAVNEFLEIFDVVWDVGLSSDGSRVAYGTQSANKLLMTDSAPYEELPGRHILPGCLAIAPDDTTIITGAENGLLRIFDSQTGALSDFEAFDPDINRVVFSPDGRWLLTGCGIYAPFSSGVPFMVLWAKGERWEMKEWPDIQSVWRASFSANGRFLGAVGEKGGIIHVWDLEETTESRIPPPEGNEHVAVALSADGHVIAALRDGTIFGRSGQEALRYPGGVTAIACSPDGHTVAAAGENGVGFWTPESSEMILLEAERFEPYELDISEDGILTARGERKLMRWQLADRRLLQSVDTAFETITREETILRMHPSRLTEVDLSRSGALLAGFDEERHLMVLALEGRRQAKASRAARTK